VPDSSGSARARLVVAINARRDCIDAYVREKSPASTRLSTISIVSSAIAAALTAGPAFGGPPFAEAVRNGLDLGQSSTVWRWLCFAAVAVSLTAAISANLSKANDLTSRIAAAQAAGALLDGVRTRLEFGRLPVEDAAQEYQDIVAGIPFVPEVRTEGRSGRGRRAGAGLGRLGPVATLATVVATLATLLLAATLVGAGIGLSRSDAAGPSTPPVTTPGATAAPPVGSATLSPSTPAPSTAAAGSTGVFAGTTDGGIATLAIAIGDDGQVRAYVCDGQEIEAWLRGSLTNGQLELTNQSGASLSAAVTDEAIFGNITVPGLATRFLASRADRPAGVYRAEIQLNGKPAIVGWAVLPDGTQVGLVAQDGPVMNAPPLDTETLTFDLNGTWQAQRVGA
jgi:hypothetical protein